MDLIKFPKRHLRKAPTKAQGLVNTISEAFRHFTDPRKPSNNTKYSLFDAVCSAFSVFFTQSPSFLSFQRDRERSTGKSNVKSLFGVHHVPSDNQIRNMIDPVSPQEVAPLIQKVGDTLKEEGCLEDFRVLRGSFLVALDGTDTFSSESHINCSTCHVSRHSDGRVQNRHIALTPAFVAPGESRVVSLPPEFIVPQDGHEKQDCDEECGLALDRPLGFPLCPLERDPSGR